MMGRRNSEAICFFRISAINGPHPLWGYYTSAVILASSDAGVMDLSCLTSRQQELATLLINHVELGRGGILRIHWTFRGTACLGVNAGG